MEKSYKYEHILSTLCKMKGIKKEELAKILDDKDCKYLLFLLLKKYECHDEQRLYEDFNISSKRKITYGTKKAEEKFLINSHFRNEYFEVEEFIDRII